MKISPFPSRSTTVNSEVFFQSYDRAIAEIRSCSVDSSFVAAEARELFARESARRESLDARATSLIGVSGLVAAIVSGVGGVVFTSDKRLHGLAGMCVSAAYVGCLALFMVAALFGISVHTAMRGWVPDPCDVQTAQSSGNTSRTMACIYLDYTVKNYRHCNRLMGRLEAGFGAFSLGLSFILLAGMLLPIVEIK
jgi:hypothetical protein